MTAGAAPERARLAEVLGVLSLATDVAMGQPLEHGLRVCIVSVGLAARARLEPDEVHDVYELALLRWVGCTAHAHELAGWFDDEIAAHRRSATFDFGSPRQVVSDFLRHAGTGRLPLERARTVATALAKGPAAVHALFASSCEVAGRLAERFGLRAPVRDGLAHVFARWDGRGWPPLGGEAVSRLARIVHVAQDAAVFHRVGGTAMAVEVVRRRAGRAYDPAVADVFLTAAGELLDATEQPSLWDAVLDAEPGRRRYLAGAELGVALEAVADFSDLKSPWTAGHSRAVARLASASAGGEDTTLIRYASLVHDLRRVGVPNGVWERRGPLSSGEWEQVRLHPYLTERMLARSAALAPLAEVASRHHERLDGSGYHRGAGGASLSPASRLLAACDVYEALTRDRPHRPALAAGQAADHLLTEARAGRLDGSAVAAVLAAAGHDRAADRRAASLPAGLTGREVEVLRLLARGLTLKAVAAGLGISPKTAGHHAEHIYTKVGVRSRAAGTLFAVEHDLL